MVAYYYDLLILFITFPSTQTLTSLLFRYFLLKGTELMEMEILPSERPAASVTTALLTGRPALNC
jgi:hypothetical protein